MEERIESIKKTIDKWEKNPFIQKKHRQRLAMLSGSVGIVKVGADSKVEMKEKKDRVEDAIYATKAALQQGIVSGGGTALMDASAKITAKAAGEQILLNAIQAPFYTILDNAGLEYPANNEMWGKEEGEGVDVITGEQVDMIKSGIIDPVLVTKSALKNAVSVVSTIISADCVISNMRTNESDQ
jgi:chaperonin GroEL